MISSTFFKGVMQIGWCSANCQFSQDGVGVGDTENSYAYDGSKQKAWHIESHQYGSTYWRTGDIFSICLDLDQGTLKYYRNGKCLGEAFENIMIDDENSALFPAVSLAFNEGLSANFGGTLFRYPVAGYLALQDAQRDKIYRCECLLVYLVDLSHFISKPGNRKKNVKMNDGSYVPTDAVLLMFGSMIIERLAGLLHNPSVVQGCVFPYIKRLCVMRSIQGKAPLQPGFEASTLGNLLTLLWDHMHYDDITQFFSSLIRFMESTYREISSDIDYEKQRSNIVILTCLCNHTRTRKYLLNEVFFKNNW